MLAVLATGLGKTVIFSAVAHSLAAEGLHTLVIAHRRELLMQAAVTLARFGLSTGFEQADESVRLDAMPDVVLATVQTLRGSRLHRFSPSSFGLVVVDEAHHAPARSYRDVLDYFAGARVLGATATPDRADGAALGRIFQAVAYRMDIRDGIRGGWLAPIELRSVSVDALDLSHVRTVAGDFCRSDLERELVRDKVLHEVAGPLSRLAAGRRTLAFVAGVAQAHALADVLCGYGVSAAAVDGSMSDEQRDAIRSDFAAGRTQVVANAMLWTEGFDAPETSCIALVRPTRSRSLVAQMIGRGTRLAPGKTECLVLDFVPTRAPKIRLSTPADALAGKDLPDDIAQRVRVASSNKAEDLLALIANAQQKTERRVRVAEVVYYAARLDTAALLEGAGAMAPSISCPDAPASSRQVEALQRAGFDVAELTRGQAAGLFEVLNSRREAGLCTVKQARRLRAYGLRDDMSFDEASHAIDAIAANGWRPPPWLRQRYAA